MLQDLLVSLQIQPHNKNLLWMMPLKLKNVINITLFCFLQLRQYKRFPLTALGPGFWVVLKNLCLITSDNSTKQVFSIRRCSIISCRIWHSSWLSFSSLETSFAQTFHMPMSSVIIFQTFSCPADLWSLEQSINSYVICLTLTLVLLVEGLSLLESSFT